MPRPSLNLNPSFVEALGSLAALRFLLSNLKVISFPDSMLNGTRFVNKHVMDLHA